MLRPHAAHKGSFFMPALGAPTAKRLGYNDNLGTGINLKEHVKYEYLSLDGSKDSELNGSGGCLILPGWRAGPWGMQMRFDMRWNALFIRRYRDGATLWDDWERLAICAPPEVHEPVSYTHLRAHET